MAPSVPGTTTLTKGEDVVITTLASLTSFQTFTGSLDENEARTHIYVEQFDDYQDNEELQSLAPFVLIESPDDGPQVTYSSYAKNIPYVFQCNHQMLLRFCALRELPTEGIIRRENIVRAWKNEVSGIMEDFIGVAGLEDRFGTTQTISGAVEFAIESNTQLPWLSWDWTIIRESDLSQ